MSSVCLLEGPAGENVHVLFERDLIVSRKRAQQRRRGRIYVLGIDGKACLAEIGEAASPRAGHKFGETARLITVFEKFMAEIVLSAVLR